MFDALSDRLRGALGRLTGHGRITEEDVDVAMREVRLALLEADVNYKVVKDFVARVRERAIGAEVIADVNAGQMVVKIVHEELTAILGAGDRTFRMTGSPAVIAMVGLQGSGKTTSSAKLARWIVRQGRQPLLVAADPYRPAAVDQLVTLGGVVSVPVHTAPPGTPVVDICRDAVAEARRTGRDVVILDTAGRLDVDDAAHGRDPRGRRSGRTGRDAARRRRDVGPGGRRASRSPSATRSASPGSCSRRSTATLGAARRSRSRRSPACPSSSWAPARRPTSSRSSIPTASPAASSGWATSSRSSSGPRRPSMPSRPRSSPTRCARNSFTLEDFLDQMQQVKKMGPLGGIIGMIPGLGGAAKEAQQAIDRGELAKVEAIIRSMTPEERNDPAILNGSRRRRIARGSGTSLPEVNRLIKQFGEMQRLMRQMQGRGGKRPMFPMGPS